MYFEKFDSFNDKRKISGLKWWNFWIFILEFKCKIVSGSELSVIRVISPWNRVKDRRREREIKIEGDHSETDGHKIADADEEAVSAFGRPAACFIIKDSHIWMLDGPGNIILAKH